MHQETYICIRRVCQTSVNKNELSYKNTVLLTKPTGSGSALFARAQFPPPPPPPPNDPDQCTNPDHLDPESNALTIGHHRQSVEQTFMEALEGFSILVVQSKSVVTSAWRYNDTSCCLATSLSLDFNPLSISHRASHVISIYLLRNSLYESLLIHSDVIAL